MYETNLLADLHHSLEVLLALDHVHNGILEQGGEHKHQTRWHPNVDGLDVGDLGQLTSYTLWGGKLCISEKI